MNDTDTKGLLVVESAKIILTALGGWKWGNGNEELEIEIKKAKHPILIDGASVFTEVELIDELKTHIAGQSYKHQKIANSGLIQPKRVSIDDSTLFNAISITGEQSLISTETNGTFSISVAVPSTLPDTSNTPDPSISHNGTWKISDPNQKLVTGIQFTPNQYPTHQIRNCSDLASNQASTAENILNKEICVTSVSWVDEEGFPEDNFSKSWSSKVAFGLYLTSDTRPKDPLPDNFYNSREDLENAGKYRAIIQYKIRPDGIITDELLKPGYTPKPDLSEGLNRPKQALLNLVTGVGEFFDRIPVVTWFVEGFGGPHLGQLSSISSIKQGELHRNSSLKLPDDAVVISSALIKFRAGEETDKMGTQKMGSPYHVPWVWSEHAIIRVGSKVKIIANGSRFPSHRWYINRRLALEIPQEPVKVNETDKFFEVGEVYGSRKSSQTVWSNSKVVDNSEGAIYLKKSKSEKKMHHYTVTPIKEQQIREISTHKFDVEVVDGQ